MIEQILTTTRVISMDRIDAQQLERLICYCAPDNAKVAIIQDNRPFDVRDKMVAELSQRRDITVLDKVFPDPKVSDIMEMANALSDKGINIVIGLGGGSTLDSAKGVAAILSNGGDLDDYLGNSPKKRIEHKDVKLIQIPTTIGTGSEVTKFGVYTARSGRKYTLNNQLLQADIALLVGEYVYELPKPIAASTSFDALSHALETIWNRNATPLSDMIATESAIHILRCIEASYEGDLNARREMQNGACMAGIAFNMTGTAMVHAISFILSEQWHIPHGIACAFTIEDAIRLNSINPHTKRQLLTIAQSAYRLDGDDDTAIEQFVDKIVELKKKFNLAINFSDLGIEITEDAIDELFVKSLDDPKMSNNIIKVDLATIHRIIKSKI